MCATLERISIEATQTNKMIVEFGRLFEGVMENRVSPNEIVDWAEGAKAGEDITILRNALIKAHDLWQQIHNKNVQFNILTDRNAQLDQILSRIDREILELEGFAFG